MNKSLKIGAVVLGILLLAAIVIFIFVPGLPVYLIVKHKYSNIDRTIGEFSMIEVPDSFKSFTVKEISLKVPSDAEKRENGSGINFGENGVIFIMDSDKLEDEDLYENLGMNNDPWKYYEYEKEDYRHFFEKIGEKFPSNVDASSDMLWFYKDRLTSEDCLKLRFRDMDVFLELAEGKEEAWGMEDAWKLNIDGGTAYVSQAISQTMPDGLWTVIIYPDSVKSRYYTVLIKGDSDDTKKQIISSIELKN